MLGSGDLPDSVKANLRENCEDVEMPELKKIIFKNVDYWTIELLESNPEFLKSDIQKMQSFQ